MPIYLIKASSIPNKNGINLKYHFRMICGLDEDNKIIPLGSSEFWYGCVSFPGKNYPFIWDRNDDALKHGFILLNYGGGDESNITEETNIISQAVVEGGRFHISHRLDDEDSKDPRHRGAVEYNIDRNPIIVVVYNIERVIALN